MKNVYLYLISKNEIWSNRLYSQSVSKGKEKELRESIVILTITGLFYAKK